MHWVTLIIIVIFVEAAYRLGRLAESRKFPYCYGWKCPKKGCKYYVSAQSAPTFNWAIYRHTEEFPDHMTMEI